jgi:4-hydroxythreonine-4-phosphate dehydrogenase
VTVRLAVSVGCPSGIGPEVSVAAAAEGVRGARVLLVGDLRGLRDAARAVGVDASRLVRVATAAEGFRVARGRIAVIEPVAALAAEDRAPGTPSRAGGAAQLAWVDAATDLVAAGEADALVTGPVSKDAIARSGARGSKGFLGHTEHLASRLGAPEVTMAFCAGGERPLTTSLVTTHLPLAKVPRAVTAAGVARAAFWTAKLLVDLAPKAIRDRRVPRLAIAALNPHAGENGLLGHEEADVIAPGITLARKRLARARVDVELSGPVPAESAFRLAVAGDFDAVVAMYHDQATIPMKLLGFGEAVNVSLGLPIVRTSVDHGTGYDRAGKGTADPRGMVEALRLGARLAKARARA